MRRKEKEITDIGEIEGIIKRAGVCRLGLVDGNTPYVIPLNFGYESKVVPALCLGADGSICTIGNLIPEEMVEIYYLCKSGKIEQAREKQLAIFPLINLLGTRHDYQLLKESIKLLGHDVGDALMPTSKVSPDTMRKIKTELRKLGKLK